jgi:2-dehydropantoate 2-reductase
MRIAIMGAGATGGYLGARLAEAGEDVAFIARGAHLKAMLESGLHVKSPWGDIGLPTVEAADDPAAIGPVDLVLFTVKLWDTESAAASLGPLIGQQTRILTVQNGIDSVDVIAKSVPTNPVIAGVTCVSLVVAGPGQISHRGGSGEITVDWADGDEVIESFVGACRRAIGFEANTTRSIRTVLWEKLIRMGATSGSTGLLRSTIGPILANAETRLFLRQLIEEGVAVAEAEGVHIRSEFVEETIALFSSFPPTFRASMADDLAAGKPLELNWLSGRIHSLGVRHGVPTPSHSAAFRGLLLHAKGNG